jgi:hypothetical protein
MRWSHLGSIVIILAVTFIFESVFAAPLDVVLEKRVPVTRSKTKKLQVTASSRKKSHGRTAKTALLSKTSHSRTIKSTNLITSESLKAKDYRQIALGGATYTKEGEGVTKIFNS